MKTTPIKTRNIAICEELASIRAQKKVLDDREKEIAPDVLETVKKMGGVVETAYGKLVAMTQKRREGDAKSLFTAFPRLAKMVGSIDFKKLDSAVEVGLVSMEDVEPYISSKSTEYVALKS